MKISEKQAEIFKILSVNSRIQILQLIKQRSMCVNALSRHLGITSAAVSQHLRILRSAGIVTSENRGYHVHYSIKENTWSEWYGILKEVFE